MREVTLGVEDLDSYFEGALAMGRRLDEGANKVGVAKLAFESMAGLLKLLTANRWTLMATLRKLGPVSIRARSLATIAAFMPTSRC
jgi:predicted transcriptional regulator